MNEKAAGLGLTNSHFMNPHGLDHDDHYSSANDVAKLRHMRSRTLSLARLSKRRPRKHRIQMKRGTTNGITKQDASFLRGADGVKTGYTKSIPPGKLRYPKRSADCGGYAE